MTDLYGHLPGTMLWVGTDCRNLVFERHLDMAGPNSPNTDPTINQTQKDSCLNFWRSYLHYTKIGLRNEKEKRGDLHMTRCNFLTIEITIPVSHFLKRNQIY